jgi:hypothetical protein
MRVSGGKKLGIVQRRQKIADLYVQGWTQMQIAAHLDIGQTTVSHDLIEVRTEWRKSAIRDFDEARTLELQKIDRIEREAWAAWERSQKPAQSAHISDDPNHRQTKRHVRNQYGDPRFLELVNRCIAGRCALLGLAKSPVETDGDGFTFNERRDRIVAVVTALRERSGAAATGAGLVDPEPRLLCADSLGRTVDAGPAPDVPG